jgi:hypothetical protein
VSKQKQPFEVIHFPDMEKLRPTPKQQRALAELFAWEKRSIENAKHHMVVCVPARDCVLKGEGA